MESVTNGGTFGPGRATETRRPSARICHRIGRREIGETEHRDRLAVPNRPLEKVGYGRTTRTEHPGCLARECVCGPTILVTSAAAACFSNSSVDDVVVVRCADRHCDHSRVGRLPSRAT